jgi:heat shock protein HslJ
MSVSFEGTWIVAAYRDGDELVVPDPDGPIPEVTFEDDSVFGTMGINRFTGHMESELVAAPLATTRMAGPPQLMKQEDLLLRHLVDADTIDVDGEGMTMGRDGLNLVELRRSGTNETDDSS